MSEISDELVQIEKGTSTNPPKSVHFYYLMLIDQHQDDNKEHAQRAPTSLSTLLSAMKLMVLYGELAAAAFSVSMNWSNLRTRYAGLDACSATVLWHTSSPHCISDSTSYQP